MNTVTQRPKIMSAYTAGSSTAITLGFPISPPVEVKLQPSELLERNQFVAVLVPQKFAVVMPLAF